MAQASARYDEFAEWYEQWIGDAAPDAGMVPEHFVEPPAPVPTFLLWRCRRR